jgi:hypothetical protein
VHGESGQATVEWVALVLAAALVLGATAAFAGRESDRGLGEAVAKRIARTAAAPNRVREEAAPPPMRAAPLSTGAAPLSTRAAPAPSRAAPLSTGAAPAPSRAAPRTTASASSAVDAFRSVRGVAEVARHAWIVCLGYERWRHELEHPMAPTEALPVDVALDILNTCFNPHDYLLQED